MQYHARALAGIGVDVDLVGYSGTPLSRAVEDNPRIRVHRVNTAELRAATTAGLSYSAAAIVDGARVSVRLWRALRRLAAPDLILVQNPPAFPTLPVVRLALRSPQARLVVDWHNVGYTLLQRRLGRWHPAVRLGRWLERREARRADAHLCVSKGLAVFLERRFNVPGAQVLYDRPAAAFRMMEAHPREQFRQAFFGRLGVFTAPAGLVICPSSWTEDEDFDVVIEAVQDLEERIRGWEAGAPGRRFPAIIILVTGDGARRAEFSRRFAGLQTRRVHLRARWLEPDEYPTVVGSADLGLCLHRSASGLDIPIKVADLFGAGVPVCALDYGACLAERVRHGENGLLFSTAAQLADVLFDVFEGFPTRTPLLARLRAGARRSARPTWEEGWDREGRPVLMRTPASSPSPLPPRIGGGGGGSNASADRPVEA